MFIFLKKWENRSFNTKIVSAQPFAWKGIYASDIINKPYYACVGQCEEGKTNWKK